MLKHLHVKNFKCEYGFSGYALKLFLDLKHHQKWYRLQMAQLSAKSFIIFSHKVRFQIKYGKNVGVGWEKTKTQPNQPTYWRRSAYLLKTPVLSLQGSSSPEPLDGCSVLWVCCAFCAADSKKMCLCGLSGKCIRSGVGTVKGGLSQDTPHRLRSSEGQSS